MDTDVRVIIEAVPRPGLSAQRLRQAIAEHPGALAALDVADPARLAVSFAPGLGHDPGDNAPFRATVFDPVGNRAVELRGTLDRPERAELRPSADRPPPSREELVAAAAILRADPRFPAGDDVVVYRPMPPLADRENPDGTTVRRPTLGLYTPGEPTGLRHRIVAVDLLGRAVDWTPSGINPRMHHDCEDTVPEGVDALTDHGGPDQVRVRVLRGGTELWNLLVVRPRASAPQNPGVGGGVELRDVRHRGRLMLRQAHVPVLNVEYEEGTTFRDDVSFETRFNASGTDPVGWGWRLCDRPPRTILERPGTDAGGFQGVAFHHDGGELRIVSELAAGWYRYASDWRLGDDGTIRPRFGFAATRNPMTCQVHRHHAYWRFDFDIEGAGNDVVEQIDESGSLIPEPVTIIRETSRRRRHPAKYWQVRDKSSGRGYQIHPGPFDGTADAYGVSDLWFLRHHPAELYDGDPDSRNRAMLNRFVDGESINGANVVVWYAGHYYHDQAHPQPHQGELIGPELLPL
ncbi:hypothetical protein HII36_52415 [Nonomuraea sp. NN258]|uniref:hypothetical protein n=1 Tax=Nonomuraea antri TaxID=2730852 RepID=UPI001567F257|nr:hypothetical protein [Nonomuraea antri]NRQ40369.1 hypothetical protein [Nonomuraea antri]